MQPQVCCCAVAVRGGGRRVELDRSRVAAHRSVEVASLEGSIAERFLLDRKLGGRVIAVEKVH
jgi:hypothetical protein